MCLLLHLQQTEAISSVTATAPPKTVKTDIQMASQSDTRLGGNSEWVACVLQLQQQESCSEQAQLSTAQKGLKQPKLGSLTDALPACTSPWAGNLVKPETGLLSRLGGQGRLMSPAASATTGSLLRPSSVRQLWTASRRPNLNHLTALLACAYPWDDDPVTATTGVLAKLGCKGEIVSTAVSLNKRSFVISGCNQE